MKIIQHHVKYKEIHGIDKVVPMEYGEHQHLHHRLRKEGKCNIPKKELHRISHNARARARCKLYNRIDFNMWLAPNVRFYETIRYNEHTGHVGYCAIFQPYNGHHLINIEVEP